ncbi:energy transducer TonB [Pedobacter cryoconitis]|uniref:TonB family protein n=1 Tax=Pedobacter cryoconitis TaxID=188932 RepID=A0A7X0IZJ7_9SPHI|nr:energy transducer TonB [Pedobacter cryoconitis]MBB6498314.1 TonB family protein [Pedobacter cryoconitis]
MLQKKSLLYRYGFIFFFTLISLPVVAHDAQKRDKPHHLFSVNPDWDKFYVFLKTNIKYPKDARYADLSGTNQYKFSVENGLVKNITSVYESDGIGFGTEIGKVLLSYHDFKSSQNGNYTIQISFELTGSAHALKNQGLRPVAGYKPLDKIIILALGKKDQEKYVNQIADPGQGPVNNNDQEVYVTTETKPYFPGGLDKFDSYVKSVAKHPEKAKDFNMEAKVFLSFVVEKNGEITDVRILRDPGLGFGDEAARVMKTSPKWVPATTDGQIVRANYRVPITFPVSQ